MTRDRPDPEAAVNLNWDDGRMFLQPRERRIKGSFAGDSGDPAGGDQIAGHGRKAPAAIVSLVRAHISAPVLTSNSASSSNAMFQRSSHATTT